MTVKTTLLALLLTGFSLCAQIPSAKPGVVATNKDEALRLALRQALAGTTTNVAIPAPVRIAADAGAADVPGSLPPGPGTGTGTGAADPAVISSNGIVQPSNPATPGPTNRVSVPSNPPGTTNIPAANRLAVPSNPVAAPAAPVESAVASAEAEE